MPKITAMQAFNNFENSYSENLTKAGSQNNCYDNNRHIYLMRIKDRAFDQFALWMIDKPISNEPQNPLHVYIQTLPAEEKSKLAAIDGVVSQKLNSIEEQVIARKDEAKLYHITAIALVILACVLVLPSIAAVGVAAAAVISSDPILVIPIAYVGISLIGCIIAFFSIAFNLSNMISSIYFFYSNSTM